MYAYIKGDVAAIEEESLVIDNNGIGYRVIVPASILDGEIGIGDSVKIYTYFSVREDAMQLYGFLSNDDLLMFRKLIGVSGVGPKAGIAILSALGADTLRFAILSDDAVTISKAPGIGKKTAQKIILELKDKVDLMDAFERKALHTEEREKSSKNESPQSEAVLALTALGYSNAQALKAVRAASALGFSEVEDLLKAALKELL